MMYQRGEKNLSQNVSNMQSRTIAQDVTLYVWTIFFLSLNCLIRSNPYFRNKNIEQNNKRECFPYIY